MLFCGQINPTRSGNLYTHIQSTQVWLKELFTKQWPFCHCSLALVSSVCWWIFMQLLITVQSHTITVSDSFQSSAVIRTLSHWVEPDQGLNERFIYWFTSQVQWSFSQLDGKIISESLVRIIAGLQKIQNTANESRLSSNCCMRKSMYNFFLFFLGKKSEESREDLRRSTANRRAFSVKFVLETLARSSGVWSHI